METQWGVTTNVAVQAAIISKTMGSKNIWKETAAIEWGVDTGQVVRYMDGVDAVPARLMESVCKLLGLSELKFETLYDNFVGVLLGNRILTVVCKPEELPAATALKPVDQHYMQKIAQQVILTASISALNVDDHVTLINQLRAASDRAREFYLQVIAGKELKESDICFLNGLLEQVNRLPKVDKTPFMQELFHIADTVAMYAMLARNHG